MGMVPPSSPPLSSAEASTAPPRAPSAKSPRPKPPPAASFFLTASAAASASPPSGVTTRSPVARSTSTCSSPPGSVVVEMVASVPPVSVPFSGALLEAEPGKLTAAWPPSGTRTRSPDISCCVPSTGMRTPSRTIATPGVALERVPTLPCAAAGARGVAAVVACAICTGASGVACTADAAVATVEEEGSVMAASLDKKSNATHGATCMPVRGYAGHRRIAAAKLLPAKDFLKQAQRRCRRRRRARPPCYVGALRNAVTAEAPRPTRL